MPLPTPNEGEAEEDFISRCMGNETVMNDFPNQDQRLAVCFSQFRGNRAAETFIDIRAATGSQRFEVYQGRDHVVFPVVALVEGVLQSASSEAPELALFQEFSKSVPSWNGRPIVFNHPQIGGAFVSANDPQIWESSVIGQVFNTQAKDGKLRMEAWIDKGKMETLGDSAKETLQSLESGDMQEVSVGLFSHIEPAKGDHQGKAYQGIWRNILPDHLALLEKGKVGACSIKDGCGAQRMNEGNEECACEDGPEKGFLRRMMERLTFRANRTDKDVRRAIEAAMTAKGIDGFLIAVEDGAFIHEAFTATGTQMVRRPFSMAEDGTITVGDEETPVVQQTEFVDLKTNQENEMDEKNELVGRIIANEGSAFDENDRESLMSFSEEKLKALEPSAAKPAEEAKPAALPEAKPAQDSRPTPTFEELLANAAPEDREAHVHGRQLFLERKQGLVQSILSCGRNPFTEDQLKAKEFSELQALAKLADAEADYSLHGGVRAAQEADSPFAPLPEDTFN